MAWGGGGEGHVGEIALRQNDRDAESAGSARIERGRGGRELYS